MKNCQFIMSFMAAMFAMLVGGAILGGAAEEVIRWSINSPFFNKSYMIGNFIMGGIVLFLSVVNAYFVISEYNSSVAEIERLENYIKDE